MAFSTTLLPAVLATTSSASRIGTPEEISVPSVRVKRATATLRMTGPKIGVRMVNASQCCRPLGQLQVGAEGDGEGDDAEPAM